MQNALTGLLVWLIDLLIFLSRCITDHSNKKLRKKQKLTETSVRKDKAYRTILLKWYESTRNEKIHYSLQNVKLVTVTVICHSVKID